MALLVSAPTPSATFPLPAVALAIALTPMATFCDPVLAEAVAIALSPMAILSTAPVRLNPAVSPIAMLLLPPMFRPA